MPASVTRNQVEQHIAILSARGNALRTAVPGTADFSTAAQRLTEAIQQASRWLLEGRPSTVPLDLWNHLADTYRTQEYSYRQEVAAATGRTAPTTPAVYEWPVGPTPVSAPTPVPPAAAPIPTATPAPARTVRPPTTTAAPAATPYTTPPAAPYIPGLPTPTEPGFIPTVPSGWSVFWNEFTLRMNPPDKPIYARPWFLLALAAGGGIWFYYHQKNKKSQGGAGELPHEEEETVEEYRENPTPLPRKKRVTRRTAKKGKKNNPAKIQEITHDPELEGVSVIGSGVRERSAGVQAGQEYTLTGRKRTHYVPGEVEYELQDGESKTYWCDQAGFDYFHPGLLTAGEELADTMPEVPLSPDEEGEE